MCRGGKTGHLPKPKFFNVKLSLMRHTDHKNGTIYKNIWLVTFSDETSLIRRQWEIQRYQHIYIDFFNIIQLAWYIDWIITGDEAVKMSAERLKTT